MHAERFGCLLLAVLLAASTLQFGVDAQRLNKCCALGEHLFFSWTSESYECKNARQNETHNVGVGVNEVDGKVDHTPTSSGDNYDHVDFAKFLDAVRSLPNVSISEDDIVVGVSPDCAVHETDWLFAPNGFRLRKKLGTVTLQTSRRTEFAAHAWCVDLDDEDDVVAVVCPCADPARPCVRKCCHHGEAFDEESLQCVESTLKPWTPTLQDPNMTFYLLSNKVPDCEYHALVKFPHGQLTFLPDGSMKGRDHDGHDIAVEPDQFCVDVTNATDSTGEGDADGDGDGDGDGDQAVLICIVTDRLSDAVTTIKGIVTVFGAAALLATVVLVGIFPEMRQNIFSKMALCHNASLLGAFVCLAVMQLSGNSLSVLTCKILSFVLQYTFLASFFWLNSMCIEISRMFSTTGRSKKAVASKVSGSRFLWYSVYAWGVTSLISVITMFVEFVPGAMFKPLFAEAYCFFHADYKIPQLLFLYGPMAIVLAINVGLFVYTARKIIVYRRQSTTTNDFKVSNRSKQNLILFGKLFTLMGVSWVFEIVSWVVGGKNYYWLLIDCVNLLRGVFIFVIICCKRSVLNLLRRRLGCTKANEGSQASEGSTGSKSTAASQDAHEMASTGRTGDLL